MFYDPVKHAYCDTETGAIVVPLEPGDIVPELHNQPPPSAVRTPVRENSFERRDRLLAEQLSLESEQIYTPSTVLVQAPSSPARLPYYSHFTGTTALNGTEDKSNTFWNSPVGTSGGSINNDIYLNIHDDVVHPANQSAFMFSDWSLARTLQAMEFEIEAETLEERRRYAEEEEQDRDFTRKEIGASSCRKQMTTFSTFVCVAQICIMIAMCTWDGMAPQSQNPMYGPPATTMVRFGAKDTSLILYRGQWWRLFSPIMLHAGVIHLLSNVLIQLRVGGYLNLVFGNFSWITIYLMSGVFGNICSCCFLPNSVGVGSSGALLGMLSAWIVWLVFRWKKIPDQCRSQRNCQLGMVLISVAVTLGMSFSQYVDWGAHFGGAIQGILWGIVLLSSELDNKRNAWILRIIAAMSIAALWIAGICYMTMSLHPSTANWAIYAVNDDWHHHDPPPQE